MLLMRDMRQTNFSIADGLPDGTTRRERSDSLQRHRPTGSGAGCDGLEDSPCVRTTDNASHLVPELRDRAGDKPQDQASSVDVWYESQSKRHLHFFKELLPLRLRKANDQSNEAR
jgi:hypothetical protein